MARSSSHRALHPTLTGRMFKLGHVIYLVCRQQPSAARVRCYREERNVVTIVNLPLVFVLEQLADEVRLEEPA
ncbi:MAG: hypothetical protein O7C67_12580 [Gammaproteobacteria bacterium]|nr:hypothetical protein [Gammaproteobacteria bacterium]